MLEYDVSIVGGGPIGGYIAGEIARKNFKVAILEKNKKVGMPVNCAGLITPRVFELLDIPKDDLIQNKVRGANIHSPSGKILSIGGDKVHAIVINRSKFDKEIIKKAEKNGADLFLEEKLLSAQKIKKHIELKTSKENEIKSNLVIGADGPYSTIRDRFAFPEPIEFLRGIGAEITNTNIDSNYVEIFIGRKIAPGFFAWIIPTNDKGTTARVGLCINQNDPHPPKFYLSKFLNGYTSLLKDIKITNHIGGVIPLGALKKTYSSNLLIVGDAAAQVKPTSGGGIYTGLLCACHCSAVAINALKKNNFNSQFLKKYHKLWYSDLGRELFLGMKFRRIYKNITDTQMDKYIEKFQNPKIIEIISKYGDIDFPSKLVKPLLKNAPTLLKLLPKVMKE